MEIKDNELKFGLTPTNRIWVTLLTVIGGMLIGLSVSFAYDALNVIWKPMVFAEVVAKALTGAACLMLFAAFTATWGLDAIKVAFLHSSAKVKKRDDAPKSRAVIMALSPSNKRLASSDGDAGAEAIRLSREAIGPENKRDVLDVLCDRNGDFRFWNWQQPLRVIRHNMDRLEVLCVLLTKEAEANHEDFKALVSLLCCESTPVRVKEFRLNSDNYNEIYGVLKDSIDECMELRGIRPGDICIDISGGTKAYTSVATVITLNSKIVFSYIQTKGMKGEGEIAVYDAQVRA